MYVAGVTDATIRGTGGAVRVIVLMGVAGAGKTFVGRALADVLGWTFVEGDDYHPPANIEKMHRGEGLTDADRAPWLDALRDIIAGVIANDGRAVLACSALRHRYRQTLVPVGTPPGAVRFVFLDVPQAILEQRLKERRGHFAPPALLDSQLATLEKPRNALRIDGTRPRDEIIRAIRAELEI